MVAMQEAGAGAAVTPEIETVVVPKARPKRARIVLFALAVLAVLLARPTIHHAKATKLLLAFSDPDAKLEIAETDTTVRGLDGATVPARIYRGTTRSDAPGIVLVHGVHAKGIEEPRLRRFARAVASTGVVVMTPEVAELSDYHVAPHAIDTVGASVLALRSIVGDRNVGVMGMSFGGGVALLAASDPRFADHVAFVVAVGAHDDLARVSRFFATDETVLPSGETKVLHAHEYGAIVLLYDHIEDFFAPEDVPFARDALRAWLREEHDGARAIAKNLSPEAKAKVDKLFASDLASMRPAMLAEIERREGEMRAVSPRDHFAGLRAHVYLLHGEGDTVIPATETLWLAKDVPAPLLRDVLVSPAILHVELKEPTLADRARLVHFMADVLGEADAAR